MSPARERAAGRGRLARPRCSPREAGRPLWAGRFARPPTKSRPAARSPASARARKGQRSDRRPTRATASRTRATHCERRCPRSRCVP